jgi:hypothetical protein
VRDGQLPALEPRRIQIAPKRSAKGPGVRPGPSFVLTLVVALAVGGCASEQAISCPRQFDPAGLSNAELQHEEFGKIPEREATTRQTVTDTVELRRGWIERNYPGVQAVEVGEGWGVTFTRDQLGNITFHRDPDHMIVTTVATRSDCPDPDRGALLVFSSGGERVPVRFVYRSPR